MKNTFFIFLKAELLNDSDTLMRICVDGWSSYVPGQRVLKDGANTEYSGAR